MPGRDGDRECLRFLVEGTLGVGPWLIRADVRRARLVSRCVRGSDILPILERDNRVLAFGVIVAAGSWLSQFWQIGDGKFGVSICNSMTVHLLDVSGVLGFNALFNAANMMLPCW